MFASYYSIVSLQILLHSCIDSSGVYKTDIDIQHQKVVVIGNVSVDTLVKKLVKTGKHAEPWPEPAPPPAGANPPGGATSGGGKKKKKNRNKNKNPANNMPAEPAPPAAATAEGGGPNPPEKHDHARSCDEASDDEPDKPEGGGSPKKLGAGDAHDGDAGAMAPFAMTPHGKQPIAPNANGNGGGGKKKGKKGGNGNANANGDGAGAIAATVEVNPPDAPMKPAPGNAGPLSVVDAGVYPPSTAMSYPGYYAAGGHMPAPYVMSYSTANPLRSSAYYHPMVGAAYAGGASGGGYFYSTAPAPETPAPGPYYMFSEENANACSVM